MNLFHADPVSYQYGRTHEEMLWGIEYLNGKLRIRSPYTTRSLMALDASESDTPEARQLLADLAMARFGVKVKR